MTAPFAPSPDGCGWCGAALLRVHGHGQCGTPGCPLRGQNQAPCCAGEACDPAPRGADEAPAVAPGRNGTPR